MNLVIHAHTLKNETLSQPITGRFDERGGTIGRSDTNTLSLPDPERHISRLQAEVWFANGGFSIRNVGSANAIMVNGRAIAPGEGASLSHADEISVGSYQMRAVIGDELASQTLAGRAAVDSRTVIVGSAGETKTSPPKLAATGLSTGTQPSARFIPPTDFSNTVAPKADAPAAADPFADLLGVGGGAAATHTASSASDPFADLLGPASTQAPKPTAPARVPPLGPATVAPAPANRLPDDFDPFADLGAPSAGGNAGLDAFMSGTPSAAPASSGAALPADLGLGDLIGSPTSSASGGGGSLDTLFGLNKSPAPNSGGDPLAAFLAAPAPSNSGAPAAPASQDPLAFFQAKEVAPQPAAPVLPADFDHTPELKGAYVPPAVQAPAAAAPRVAAPSPAADVTQIAAPAPKPKPPEPSTVATPVQAPRPAAPPPAAVAKPKVSAPAPLDALSPRPPPAAPAANAAGNDALWAAFCEGAGIKMQPPQGLNPELMKMIGQILAQSVEGTLKLVAVRAAAKQELRAQVTTIQSRNNNPMKFSPDAPSAIEQLLQPPMRGFMFGPAAVSDVMDDLVGHAIGTMAGMRAALEGVLQRFEPKQLEGKLVGGGVIDALLPMNRRAKLWELYLQHFQRIQGEAQDDFHDLFGKAFIQAYEDQLDLLDDARHKPK